MGLTWEKGTHMAIERRFPAVQVAAARIGSLDRTGRPRARGSLDHAVWVWEAARRAVIARVPGLERMTWGRGKAAFEGQVDLVLLALLATHLRDCQRCWTRWADGYRPADILSTAIKRRPAGQILRAAETEMKSRRRGGRR